MLRSLIQNAFPRHRPRNILHFPNYKLAYFVVPKSGNTSVRNFLLPLLDPELDQHSFTNVSEEVQWNYITPRALAGADAGYFTFAITRNPFDRVISTFQDKVSHKWVHPALAEQGFHKGMSFPEFVEQVGKVSDKDIDFHLKSQAYLLEHRGKLQPKRLFDINALSEAEIAVKRIHEVVQNRYRRDFELLGYDPLF